MPDTAEHRVNCHVAAAELRRQGRPIWSHTVELKDVFHEEDMTFEERRDEIVRRIKRTRWYQQSGEWSDLRSIVHELGDAETVDDFDHFWDELYDRADADRVWISTF